MQEILSIFLSVSDKAGRWEAKNIRHLATLLILVLAENVVHVECAKRVRELECLC